MRVETNPVPATGEQVLAAGAGSTLDSFLGRVHAGGDLASLCAALVSAFRDRPLPSSAVFFGEVGLAGEVRRVSRPEARIGEAAKLGFERVFAPPGAASATPDRGKPEVQEIRDLAALLDAV